MSRSDLVHKIRTWNGSDLESISDDIADLIEQMENDLDSNRERLLEFEVYTDELGQEVDDMKEEIEALERLCESYQSENARLEEERVHYRNKYQEAVKTSAELKTDITSLRDGLRYLLKDYDDG